MSVFGDAWAKTRANGRLAYVLQYGVFGWGAMMFVVMTFVVGPKPASTVALVFDAVLWGVGGALFGVLTWYFNERNYQRKLAAEAAAPGAPAQPLSRAEAALEAARRRRLGN